LLENIQQRRTKIFRTTKIRKTKDAVTITTPGDILFCAKGGKNSEIEKSL